MKTYHKTYQAFSYTILFCFMFFSGCSATKPSLQPVRIALNEITWQEKFGDGLKTETIILAGDPSKNSFYTIRVRIPKGMKLMPHFHPEERMVTIIQGTLLVGYGITFDESKLKDLPVGSFFTEPGNEPHFVWAKENDVIVQASGTGPTKTTFCQPYN
jgi:quercetin dioxygenase-like cupin family protein